MNPPTCPRCGREMRQCVNMHAWCCICGGLLMEVQRHMRPVAP